MKTGDQVVCVKSHPHWVVQKGQIYTVLAILTCKCGDVAFDVGISFPFGCDIVICDCGEWYNDYIPWVDAYCFAPIQRKSDEFLSFDKIEKSVEEKIDIEIPIEV